MVSFFKATVTLAASLIPTWNKIGWSAYYSQHQTKLPEGTPHF